MRRIVLEQPVSRAATWAGRLALFAAVVTLYGVLVVRSGQHGPPGLAALGSGFVLALMSSLVATIGGLGIWNHGLRGASRVFFALFLASLLLAAPAYVAFQYWRLPKLNDISTDIDDPPFFSRSRAALAARDGHVPIEHSRESRQPQREAYQRIIPVILELPAEEAYTVVQRAVANLGWRVIEQSPPGGRTGSARIEAIATTRLLRFADDVTIRIRPRLEGSRIDIRSASRLGQHDLGVNAARIQAFADEIQALVTAR
jgi:uncharacterized protein (DUF1499 family)